MLKNVNVNLEEELQPKPNPMNTIKLKLILNQYTTAFLLLEALDFERQAILAFILLRSCLLTFLTS